MSFYKLFASASTQKITNAIPHFPHLLKKKKVKAKEEVFLLGMKTLYPQDCLLLGLET